MSQEQRTWEAIDRCFPGSRVSSIESIRPAKDPKEESKLLEADKKRYQLWAKDTVAWKGNPLCLSLVSAIDVAIVELKDRIKAGTAEERKRKSLIARKAERPAG